MSIREGVAYRSNEELYFSYYLEELKEAGYIKEWSYETSKFELSTTVSIEKQYEDLSKVKETLKKKEVPIDQGKTCTADFTIIWEPIAEGLFYYNCGTIVEDLKLNLPFIVYSTTDCISFTSYIEIKPEVENTRVVSSSVSFPYKASWVLDKYGVYIQKIKPLGKGGLFHQTFVPKKYIDETRYKKDYTHTKSGFKYKAGDISIKWVDPENIIYLDVYLNQIEERKNKRNSIIEERLTKQLEKESKSKSKKPSSKQ